MHTDALSNDHSRSIMTLHGNKVDKMICFDTYCVKFAHNMHVKRDTFKTLHKTVALTGKIDVLNDKNNPNISLAISNTMQSHKTLFPCFIESGINVSENDEISFIMHEFSLEDTITINNCHIPFLSLTEYMIENLAGLARSLSRQIMIPSSIQSAFITTLNYFEPFGRRWPKASKNTLRLVLISITTFITSSTQSMMMIPSDDAPIATKFYDKLYDVAKENNIQQVKEIFHNSNSGLLLLADCIDVIRSLAHDTDTDDKFVEYRKSICRTMLKDSSATTCIKLISSQMSKITKNDITVHRLNMLNYYV